MNETTGSEFSWADLKFMPAAPTKATLKVNHDNILGAAKIIQAQIDALEAKVLQRARELWVQPSGEDPVSIEAAEAWNHRLVRANDSYLARVGDYVRSLRTLIDQMRESAKTYKLNESDIAATFGDRRA